MKKFLKLCMAVAALATMFGFASCSNGSDDTTAAAAATTTATTSAATTAATPETTTATKKTVETKSITINGVTFTYTTTDGKVDTSATVKVADDGSITVTASDGSKVTLSKDGKTITYTDKNGTSYTGEAGGESITLKSSDGKQVSATLKTETKSVPVTPVVTPAATENVFKGKTFTSPENKIFFIFGSDGKVIFAQDKEKIFTETYTVTGNDFTFTVAGQNKISGSLSGTALTAGDAAHGNGTFAQTSGTNGFAGKSFITADGTKLVVVVSDSLLVMLEQNSDVKKKNYTVQDGKVIGDNLEATLSGKTLTVKVTKGGVHTDTATLIE